MTEPTGDLTPDAAAAEAALPHSPADPFAVVILKPVKRPYELDPGIVARLTGPDAGKLVRLGHARPATPDDIAIAGIHFRTFA